MDTQKKLFVSLIVLLSIGMLDSLFLVYEHFSPTASKYCTFGEGFDCGIVNKSPYANLDGISYLLTIDFKLPIPLIDIAGLGVFFDLVTSNAFLGFLTLLFILLLLIARYEKKGFLWVKYEKTTAWIKGLLIFGVIYGFYLFLIQHFILKTYCLFCLFLDLILLIGLILAWRLKK
ncbi:MAG: hypothetical protein ISS25_03775 [Nanoarchaeota archaeon]|nr:hypothetical protein [DPANN group archaeon]MBL7116922.1 hypothetical protein [Nanoarchaeota archaeon]